MNINKLRGKIVEQGLTVADLADEIGVDKATLYRKLKNESFSIKEAGRISKTLGLSGEDATAIFFNDIVALHAT